MGGPVGCLLVLCFLGVVWGYPSGPPDNADICQSMKPGHRPAPEVLPPAFMITLSEEAYLPGEKVNVTIKAKKDFVFKGFFIQARRVDPNADQLEPIGRFMVIEGTKEVCNDRYGNGLSHTNTGPKGLTEKREIVLTWVAPTPPRGHVQFRVTVVSRYDTYWVQERSSILRDPSAAPLPQTRDPFVGRTLPPLEPISLDECGKSKGCYRYPEECSDNKQKNQCDAYVTWKDKKDSIDFELSGDSHGWVALGFSYDKLMGHDSVVECVWSSESHTVQVRQSYNLNGDKTNRVIEGTRGLSDMQGFLSNGHIKCRFSRRKRIPNMEKTMFDLSESFHLLIAKGDVNVTGGKLRHNLEPYKFPLVSPVKVDFSQNVDISGRARYALVKAHGCLMIIAWMMSASLGIIMARYYKRMWPNDRLCANKVWFSVHRFCQLLAMFCTIVGVILIFVHMGGWHHLPDYPAKAHPPLGIAVLVLTILNPLVAACRPSTKKSTRPVFNWFHWLFGSVAYALAAPTLFIGLSMPKAFTPSWATWVLVAFYLFHVIIELLLEIHGCINGRKQKQRDLEYDLRKRSDPRGELDGYEPEPVGTRFKTILIWMYVVVMVILGIVMVIAVAVS